jgi:hypothetical protein
VRAAKFDPSMSPMVAVHTFTFPAPGNDPAAGADLKTAASCSDPIPGRLPRPASPARAMTSW